MAQIFNELKSHPPIEMVMVQIEVEAKRACLSPLCATAGADERRAEPHFTQAVKTSPRPNPSK